MLKGLPTKIQLENGKFKLMSGEDKADDNMNMFMSFFGFFRLYTEDFAVNTLFLYSKNLAIIRKRRAMLALALKDAAATFIKSTRVNSVVFTENMTKGNKELNLDIVYSYNLMTKNKSKRVIFKKTL